MGAQRPCARVGAPGPDGRTACRACCRSGPAPSPCAHSAAMETHGCASASGDAAPHRGRPTGRGASRPDAVIRATNVPSAISRHGALARAPSPGRGTRPPSSVRGTGSSSIADAARVAVGLPPALPIRDEAQVTRPRSQSGWPTDSATPPATRCAGPAARSTLVRRALVAGNPAEGQDQQGRGVPGHVRMVPGDHGQTVAGRMRPGRAEEVVPVEQRGLAGRAGPGREGDHACAPAAPIPRDGPPGRPGPTGRPPWRSARRDCAPRPPEAARSAPPARPLPDRSRAPAPSQNHTRWSDWST